jgi:hypothetical protein
VNNTTGGKQVPWESSSLTSDFYFFGDTAVASTRAPNRGPVVASAGNLPSRSVQQAYDFVLSEGQPQYYQQFIELYPHDPLCDRIRWLLRDLIVAQAWHKAVLANSPFAYKTFADNFADNPLAKVAQNLQATPKAIPLMQATHLIVSPQLAPNLKQPVNFGLPKDGIKIGENNGQMNGQLKAGGGLGINLPGKGDNNAGNGNTGINGGGKIVTLPAPGGNAGNGNTGINGGKIVTLPANNGGNGNNGPANTGINGGKISTLPVNNGGKTVGQDSKVDVKTSMPVNRVTTLPSTPRQQLNSAPVMKLNQGNPQLVNKMSFGSNNGSNNGGSRMAMGGGMRRGF